MWESFRDLVKIQTVIGKSRTYWFFFYFLSWLQQDFTVLSCLAWDTWQSFCLRLLSAEVTSMNYMDSFFYKPNIDISLRDCCWWFKKKMWEEKQRPSRKNSRLDLLLVTCFYPTLEWEAVAFLFFLLQRAVYMGAGALFFFFLKGRKPSQLLSFLCWNSKQFWFSHLYIFVMSKTPDSQLPPWGLENRIPLLRGESEKHQSSTCLSWSKEYLLWLPIR